MHLFFDTETTGLPRSFGAPVSDLDNWPRVVQVAWLVTDGAGAEVGEGNFVVKPDGFTIPADAARVHGITTERAVAEGIDIGAVLTAFVAGLQQASVLVAHNIAFDGKIMGAELLRAGFDNLLDGKRHRCTMRETTNYCRLPGKRGYKWPTLQELHKAVFSEPFEGAHDALGDVRACARCYFALRRSGVMA